MADDAHSERDAPPQKAGGGATDASEKEQLEQLIATATANYAQKQYRVAAETYSRATELQAQINGEMAPQNADLLYAYGRCLYHVAVQNSEVLGSKLAGEAKSAPATKKGKASSSKAPTTDAALPASSEAAAAKEAESAKTEELVEAVVEEKQAVSGETAADESASKPYFVFTGDEGYDESDEEEDDAGGEGEAEGEDEEDDDFSNAFEVLDLARVLFERQIEDKKATANGSSDSSSTRQLEERLADTYDLQAEISLEGEQFSNAATDLRSSLKMKLALYALESSIVAEAHYKLSLALEFAAVTHHKDANGEIDSSKPAVVDQGMRNEAAEQMEQAIASCKKRIELEEAKLAAGTAGEAQEKGKKGKITRQSIDEVKEMVEDMEQRVCSPSRSLFCLHN
jgi:HAT1-interacting factor 1